MASRTAGAGRLGWRAPCNRRHGMGSKPDDASVDALARAATEEHAAAGTPAPETPPRRRPPWLPWTVVAVAALVVALRVDAIRGALAPPPPLRQGSQETDPDLDRCVERLWELAAVLGQAAPDAATAPPAIEPLSGRPYVVRREEGDTLIECPTPDRHHARAVRARASDPEPEVLR